MQAMHARSISPIKCNTRFVVGRKNTNLSGVKDVGIGADLDGLVSCKCRRN